MADDILGAPGAGGGKPKSKLAQFVKKNKTLSAILGVGGVWLVWRELHKNEEVAAVEAIGGEASAVERGEPLEPSEGSHEGIDSEIGRIEGEVREGREQTEREDEQIREGIEKTQESIESIPETVPNDPGYESPEPAPREESSEAPASSAVAQAPTGVSIHGKNFPGAKGYRIKGGGQAGGKQYTEYVLEYPGKNEAWQYFPSSGNWRPTPATGNVTSTTHSAASKSNNGAAAATTAAKAKAKAEAKSQAEGVKASGKGGGGGGGGGNNSCPAGTVQNIQQNRNEVNRLTEEIKQLHEDLQKYPKAEKRGEWQQNIQNKEQKRNECQGAVDRGRAQPGCGNV